MAYIQVNVRIPAELLAAFDVVADERKRTRSSLLRELMERVIYPADETDLTPVQVAVGAEPVKLKCSHPTLRKLPYGTWCGECGVRIR